VTLVSGELRGDVLDVEPWQDLLQPTRDQRSRSVLCVGGPCPSCLGEDRREQRRRSIIEGARDGESLRLDRSIPLY
jgi:hypothetical protein